MKISNWGLYHTWIMETEIPLKNTENKELIREVTYLIRISKQTKNQSFYEFLQLKLNIKTLYGISYLSWSMKTETPPHRRWSLKMNKRHGFKQHKCQVYRKWYCNNQIKYHPTCIFLALSRFKVHISLLWIFYTIAQFLSLIIL